MFGFGAMRFAGKRVWIGGAAAQTVWDFSDFATATLGTGQAQIVSPSVARANRLDTSNAGGISLELETGTYRLRGNLTVWNVGTTPQMRLRTGAFPGAADITPDSGLNNYFTAGPVDTTFTLSSPATFLLLPTTNGRSFTLTKGADPLLEKVA